MNQLQQMFCPECLRPMENSGNAVKPTAKYKDCIRKCQACGIGYSNSVTTPTLIFEDPRKNIPGFVDSSDFLEILEKSNNRRNISNKKCKAGFSTSEDAVTYTFVKSFSQTGSIERMMRVLGLEVNGNHASLFLWGCPILKGTDITLIQRMNSLLRNEFAERANSLTEPDIILSIEGYGIVIIEVKLHSPNEIKATGKLSSYLDRSFYTNLAKAQSSQHYELVRNWSIGNALSENDSFTLINLGKESLFKDRNASKLKFFKESLNCNEKHQFAQVSWEEIIDRLEEGDSYLRDYLEEKVKYR